MALAPPFRGRLRLPVIAAPMFIVTGPDLVVACCREGIACAVPALNARTTDGFRTWLQEISERCRRLEDETQRDCAPFGVNLIVHQSNARLIEDMRCVIEARAPFVVTSLGAVRDVVARIHDYGGVVLHDVINIRHAEKAIEAGVDGIIAVTAGAGGHAGAINPFAFLAELKQVAGERMLALAGSLSTGGDIAAAVAAGADVAYMGTRFIATEESAASSEYKAMLVRSGSKDIVYTPKISGVNANFLAESITRAGLDLATLEPNPGMDLGHEAKAWSTIWSAGHGVGAIKSCLPVAQLIDELEDGFKEARSRIAKWPL
jgi:nitronate monooxygenase